MITQDEYKALIQVIQEGWNDYRFKVVREAVIWSVGWLLLTICIMVVAGLSGADEGTRRALSAALLCANVGGVASYGIKLFQQARVTARLIQDQRDRMQRDHGPQG